jgi:6-phosphogluconolactonase/glucosamine-6-phosphate isomerase/deaminase
MSLVITTTTNPEEVANFVATSVMNKLASGKRVLLFLTGGSSTIVGVKIAELLRRRWFQNLTVMLTDERYGPIGHTDSNWQQMLDKGFSLSQSKLIPILTGDNRDTTTEKFNIALNEEFMRAEYKIGLFGIGTDGHTAGILPQSRAVRSKDLALGYDTPTFSRITITPKAIGKLDEAVVWAQGKDKWPVLKNLEEKKILLSKQPAQILKKVPLLTIFSDYKNE